MRKALCNIFLVLLVAAGGGVLFAEEPVFADAAREANQSGRGFSFVVEQGGERYIPDNGEIVTIERAPFIVWVAYADVQQIMLHVHSEPTVFEPISSGRSLEEAMGEDLDMMMGMAEYNYNVQRKMFLDPFGAHYLQVPNIEGHRFNRTYHHADFTTGGRDVQTLVDLEDEGVEYAVKQAPYEIIYFSGIYGERDSDYRLNVLETLGFALRFTES